MKTLYFILISILLPFTLMAQSSSPEGEWFPDSQSRFGEITVKQTGENEYKIRLNFINEVRVVSATLKNGVLYGKFEYKSPQYGEFWVGNGLIEKGRENEILVGKGSSYGSYGAVGGWLSGNIDYRQTDSRQNCATVEESYCWLKLEINGDRMTAYFKLRGEYLKGERPMFYQESSWVKESQYIKW